MFNSILFVNQSKFNLLMIVHHISFDGLSSSILMREFNLLIESSCTISESFVNNSNTLDSLVFQYLDYSVFEHDLLKSKEGDSAMQWWVSQLVNSESHVTDLPLDRSRTRLRSGKGFSLSFLFLPNISSNANKWYLLSRLTLYMALHSILHVLFSRLCQQDEVILGSVNANRYMDGLDKLIGMFVNTIVHKTAVDNTLSFSRISQVIREHSIEIMSRSFAPFDEVLHLIKYNQVAGTSALFQMLTMTALEDVKRAANVDTNINSIVKNKNFGCVLPSGRNQRIVSNYDHD